MNKVILLGNLTRDIELKTIPSGQIVGNTGIATNENYVNKQGEKVDKVSFHNLTVWGKQAETLAQYTQKGSKLLVEGKISYRKWEKEDGTKGMAVDIIVDRFEFAGSKQNNQNNQNQNNHQNNNAPATNNAPANNAPVNNAPAPDGSYAPNNNAPVNNAPNNNRANNGEYDEIKIEDIPF